MNIFLYCLEKSSSYNFKKCKLLLRSKSFLINCVGQNSPPGLSHSLSLNVKLEGDIKYGERYLYCRNNLLGKMKTT